jgi:hypothetical protein
MIGKGHHKEKSSCEDVFGNAGLSSHTSTYNTMLSGYSSLGILMLSGMPDLEINQT